MTRSSKLHWHLQQWF